MPKGIIPAMATPCDRYGNVKEAPLRQLVNHLIDGGVHALFPVGSQGEFWALTFEQKKKVLEIVMDETNGRVPVWAGTGALTTHEAIATTKMAAEMGVAGVSILTPYFTTLSQRELIAHYTEIAKAVPDVPILLYSNPDRTGQPMTVDTVVELAKVDNIIGIKDSSGDMTLTAEYVRRTRGMEFSVLMGRDTLIYGGLCYGCAGSIAATANIKPALLVEIYEAFQAGDHKRALEAQYALAPLRIAFGMGTFPVVIKEALKMIGIDAGEAIAPVGTLSDENRAKLRQVLVEMGCIK